MRKATLISVLAVLGVTVGCERPMTSGEKGATVGAAAGTGIGLVTPVGIGTQESWRALLAGESGIGPITRFDASTFRVRIAGEVKNWEPEKYIDKKKLKELGQKAARAVE